MTSIEWDPKAREFLRKLPQDIAKRIFKKVDMEITNNVKRYLETLVGRDGYKIRIGDYRLFVDYSFDDDNLKIISNCINLGTFLMQFDILSNLANVP